MNASELLESSVCLRVADHFPERGWEESADAADRANWCCQRLEEGRILLFDEPPFTLSDSDRDFLLRQRLGGSQFHKNISYRPSQDRLRGFPESDPATAQRLHLFMRRYSAEVTRFLTQLLTPYARHWKLDYASFRPESEQGRKLPTRKRNDLLHVDAFPSRPTRGGRILRCFTNINASQARVWQTTDGFATLVRTYAKEAGLDRYAGENGTLMGVLGHLIKQALRLQPKGQTAYDRFMLRFHDYLKENSKFQQECPKATMEFVPGSTWICFTDAVPHSVIQGQYALEQTLMVPFSAMLSPELSPLRVLEAAAGRPLVMPVLGSG